MSMLPKEAVVDSARRVGEPCAIIFSNDENRHIEEGETITFKDNWITIFVNQKIVEKINIRFVFKVLYVW